MAEAKKQMYRVVDHEKDYRYEKENFKPRKSPEEKQYLVCITAKRGSGENDVWTLATGRTEAYEMIKECISYTDLNISFVLTEDCTLMERVSIYQFMKKMAEIFTDDSFDIEDYVHGDWSESDFIESSDIDMDMVNQMQNRINPEEMMNGSYTIHDLG